MIRFILVLFVAFASVASAQDVPDTEAGSEIALDIRLASDVVLDDFLWLNRLIVVFADSDRDPSFKEQMELLNERPEPLIERDVVVIMDTDPRNPSDVRTELRPRGFGFVLIDKDGVIKLRKPVPWDVREITHSIDKTELRQQEVRDAREADGA